MALSAAQVAAVQADHGGDAEIAARDGGLLLVNPERKHLNQRLVPSPALEEQLPQGRAARPGGVTAPTPTASSSESLR